MAKFVQKDGTLKVDTVDLSSHASTVNVVSEKERVDVTGQTTSGYREETDGFATAEITVTFFSDEAAGKTIETLYPLYTAGSIFNVSWKPQAAGTVVWSLPQAKLYNFNPSAAGVGDAASFDATFSNAGTAGLTKGTTI
jgi:hypothetical protein